MSSTSTVRRFVATLTGGMFRDYSGVDPFRLGRGCVVYPDPRPIIEPERPSSHLHMDRRASGIHHSAEARLAHAWAAERGEACPRCGP